MRIFLSFIWLVASFAAAFTALIFIARVVGHDTQVARVAEFVEQKIIAAAASDESLSVPPPAKVEPQPQARAWIVSGELCRSLGKTECWELKTLTAAGGDPTSATEESHEFSLVTNDIATLWTEFAEQLDLTAVATWLEDNLSELPLEDQKTVETKSLSTDPAVVAGDNALIQLYQKALKNAGFNPGPIDGQYGPSTGKALRSYQTTMGLAPSGDFDKPTLEALSPQHTGPTLVKLARAVYVSSEEAGNTNYKGLLAALVGLLAISLWFSGGRLLFRRHPA